MKCSQPVSKVRNRPSNTINRQPWQGWIRYDQLPIGKTLTRKLIDQGLLVSAIVQGPGSRRGVRLIETASLDRYLKSLAEEQRKKEVVPAQ